MKQRQTSRRNGRFILTVFRTKIEQYPLQS